MNHLLRIVIALIAGLLAVEECAHAQTRVAGLEEGLVTAQMYQVSRRDLVAYFSGDTLFIPYRTIARYLGMIHAVSSDSDTLSGELPTGTPFTYVVSRHSFERNGERDTLAPGALRSIDGDVLIRVDELNRTLRLAADYDAEQLTLTIPPDRSIPAVDAKAALRRYARLGDGAGLADAAGLVNGAGLGRGAGLTEGVRDEIVALSRSMLGPIALDWGASSMMMGEHTASYGNVTLSTPFLYGVLGLRGRAGLASEATRVDLGFEGATWRLDLPELPMLQAISLGFRPSRLGASYSVGLSGSTHTGTPHSYGSRTIDGEAPAGWWAELYDGPRLIDAVRIGEDGTYSFEVPMRSSVTTRRVSVRGPHGEREWQTRTFAIGGDMLPAGDLRWNLGGSTYRYLANQAATASAGITLGIDDRVTVDVATRLPATYVDRISADSLRTSIGVRMALFDATPVSLTLDPQSWRFGASFTLDPLNGMPVRARLDSVDVVRRTFDLSLSSRLTVGPVSLSAIGRYVDRWDRHGYEFSPKVATRVLGVSLSTSLRASRMEFLRGQTEIDDRSVERRLLVRTQASFSPWRRVRVRFGGSYDVITGEIVESSVGVTLPILNWLSLGTSYAMHGTDWRNGAFSANLGLNLKFARGSVSSRYDAGRLTTQSRLGGSLVLGAPGIDVVQEHATSRAQLFVHGYVDRNLNGAYDGDDVSLGPIEATVLIGGARIASGSRFETLPPRRSLIVEIDAEQFANGGLYPLRARHEIALSSGTAELMMVPFARGMEIFGAGRIDLPSGRAGQVAALMGLRVRLVATSGVAEYEGEFINDGTYMLTGVAPGEYRFEVDESVLATMGLALESLPATVMIEPGIETLPELVFIPLDNASTPSDADALGEDE